MTIIDEAIKAKAEYEQKKDAAIKELLNRQREIEAQLKNLGYHAVATKTKDQGPAKGQRICSKCKKAGHNSRTCPENKAKDHKGKVSRNAAA